MPNKSAFSALIAAWVAAPSIILFFCAGSARAQTGSGNYSFLLASGFLCDLGESSSCPAVAESANGNSYEISGAGTLDTQNKSVKAAGTFNRKSANGDVLETGVWTASDLISFVSYGIAPGALIKHGPAFRSPKTGHERLLLRSGPLPTGGLATFHVLLMPLSGTTKAAVLQVNCALGDVPHERSIEGIRITLERNNSEYSEEASGRVMFLALRPELRMPAKMPEQEARPEASDQPQK